MNVETILEGLTLGWYVISAIGGWYINAQRREIRQHKEEAKRQTEKFEGQIDLLNEKLMQHKLYAAENFISKLDLEKMMGGVIEWLKRIEGKLDKKVDKQ